MRIDDLILHAGRAGTRARRIRLSIFDRYRKGWILKSSAKGAGPRDQQTPGAAQRSPTRIFLIAALALLAAGASWWLMLRSNTIQCGELAPLTVLATLAAFLISVCFRLMGRYTDRRSRWILLVCVLFAAATIFTDFRFVRRYRGFCEDLRQQMHHVPSSQ
ncbi:MAG TPA: hypothetical protein VMD92_02975 [Acidobacteriaceae bacterium]|jgi:hypothetical protein|nr:hypothetical protein [Acidobacteriaceae bacterium]